MIASKQQPRHQLTDPELKQALEECAREPIHIPGSIQPHGVLLAVATVSREITFASANADALFGIAPEKLLGRSVDELFGASTESVLSLVTVETPLPVKTARVAIGGKAYDAVASRTDGQIILEFEPCPDDQAGTTDGFFYYDELRALTIALRESGNEQALFQLVVDEIRNLTRFDRVMLYRFDPDWNGEVVSEARADFMNSYLAHNFPASDIPEQARQLYMKSYLRLIPDISYRPTPLLSSTGRPLDLSLSVLRSVSPVHIQYLDNMNIKASMSVSILQNGKLWGLIACHHNTPHHVAYRIRMVAETIGHIFSAQLSTLGEMAASIDEAKRVLLIEKLSAAVGSVADMQKLFDSIAGVAIDAMKADGLAILQRDAIYAAGDTLSHDALREFYAWLVERAPLELIAENDSRKIFADRPGLKDAVGGFLAAPVTLSEHDFIVWFRKPVFVEMKWAGKPEKNAEMTKGGYRLTPRSSFDLYVETQRHKAAPWNAQDLVTAQRVVRTLLETKQIAASQANMAKSEFLANLSHELRTPMNAIVGLSNILAVSQPLSEKQRMYVNTLQTSADTLLALINDLLDISRIEARSVELEAIPFDLNRLVQEVISMMSVRSTEKGLNFKVENDTRQSMFIGDPTRLRQVIVNLCSNAVKFTHQGTITIRIHSEAMNDRARNVVISVEDTGIGIPDDKLNAIFEKFTQADVSTVRQYGGTGLGLTISRMLVELMGGQIGVESRMGTGSTFTFNVHLQISEDQAHVEPEETPQPLVEDPKIPKILVVEDFEPNALVVTAFLDDFGYSYDIVPNGVGALEKIRNSGYFAILMDVQMAGMNGFQTTESIRAYEKDQNRKPHYIIGMTAHALTGDRERCYAAGMDDYIPKPFNPKELKSKLLSALFHNKE